MWSTIEILLFLSLIFFVSTAPSLDDPALRELRLYDDESMQNLVHTFRSNVLDVSTINFTDIRHLCYRGLWHLYTEPNYGGYKEEFLSYGGQYVTLCNYLSTGEFKYKSIRKFGADEVDSDSLSLYTGYLSGDEIIVADPDSLTTITMNPQSLVITGMSNWTIFEGPEFQGDNQCIPRPHPFNGRLEYYSKSKITIDAIRSVRKGC